MPLFKYVDNQNKKDTSSEKEKQIRSIETKIRSSAQKYYADGSSQLTDKEFDLEVEKLRKLDPHNSLLQTPGWGYDPNKNESGKKYKHKYKKEGSLDKVHSWNDLKDFQNHIADVSLKLDGLSCILYYKDNILQRALTRGNGEVGIDITNKIQLINNGAFQKIHPSKIDSLFTGAIRGELLIDNVKFELFKNNHENVKNPRNSAAGIINGKDTLDDMRYISLICYTIEGYEAEEGNYTELDTIRRMRYLLENMIGAENVVPYAEVTSEITSSNFDSEMYHFRDKWYSKYPADGLVLTKERVEYDRDSSAVNTLAVAYKFPSESKETTVRNIEWNLSKNNKLIPVFVVDPVELSGSTVSRATGFNTQYIIDNHVGVGSRVEIAKMNEIIPNITRVITHVDSEIPVYCPICNHKLVRKGVDIYCVNNQCENQVLQDTIWFMKNASPVEGLSDLLIEKDLRWLKSEYLIDDLSIESVMNSKVQKLDTTESKQWNLFVNSWNNLHDSNIKIPFSTCLYALNIERLGEITCNKLSSIKYQLFEYLKELPNITTGQGYKSVSQIVGPATTESLATNYNRFKRLMLLKDKIEDKISPVAAFKGSVSITGKLSVSRKEFEKQLNEHGWKLEDLKKTTSYLITDDPNSGSSKNQKADKFDVKKITEAAFRRIW